MITNRKTANMLAAGSAILAIAHAIGAPMWCESFLIVFLLISGGRSYGALLLRHEHPAMQYAWGGIGMLSAFMLSRGVWFYLGLNLNGWGDVVPAIVIFLLAAAILAFLSDVGRTFRVQKDRERLPRRILYFILCGLSLSAVVLIASTVHRAGTTEAIRTPWPLLPPWLLPLIAAQWAITLASAWRLGNRAVSAVQTACALASTTIITPLIYRIGYGFDGFLHIAGERILLQTGTLSPKPAYYMGQYVFTTWVSKLVDFDISLIDRWLVPCAAAILLSLAAIVAAGHKKPLILPALILVPIGAFIATTPHGFATVLGITAVILAIGVAQSSVSPALPLVVAAWSALTHPLVGIPVFCMSASVAFYRRGVPWRSGIAWLIAIGSGLSVPVVFGLASVLGSSSGVAFDIGRLVDFQAWTSIAGAWFPWVQNRYAVWPETSVWIERLLPWITILLAIGGVWRAKREQESVAPWLGASASAAFSAVILGLAGDFAFLIDYERGNYAERLWLVAWLFLLPLAIPELAHLFLRMRQASRVSLVGMLVAIGILGAGMSYAALPRHDAVTPSRGWSVGSADIEAVRLIDEDSADESYTVLANQSVSAAAVRSFGFKRYNEDIFFYPIPTGGRLYETFLRASYEDPSRDIMHEAANLGGSDLVYFVVNDYWWKAKELIEKARVEADRVFEIQDGKVTVFKYDFRVSQ